MFHSNDTICAPATPAGTGAIAVVRISGPDTQRVVLAFLADAPLPSPGRLERRFLTAPTSGMLLDEAMVVCFVAPATYTGEDTAELHLHGSPLLVEEVLNELSRLGVRHAQPGEFTLRAFLNGKKDLTQAEAVQDLVQASSPGALTLALGQLTGSVSRALTPLEEQFLKLVALLEAEIDFPEDVPEMSKEDLRKRLIAMQLEIDGVLAHYEQARLLRSGFRVVLVGAPNAGKSSLFNSLLKNNRAIVTDEAGTTRDFLEEHLAQRPVPVVLVDTAGFRTAVSQAEKVGVERSQDQLDGAHLVVLVVDPTTPWSADDARIEEATRRPGRLVVSTHVDVADASGALSQPLSVDHRVSCINAGGVDELRTALLTAAKVALGNDATHATIVSRRQQQAVLVARDVVLRAQEDLWDLPVDVLASSLREGLEALYEVTGKGMVAEDVLEEIFSNFCIGK